MKEATLCLLIKENQKDKELLLAMKKRGFGVGKWNGVGGKFDFEKGDQNIEQTAIRETEKEIAGAEEVIEETIKEELEESQSNLLASIGSFVGGLSCLPWWLILILAAYCFIEAAIIHQRRKKQDILLSRINAKKELVWFIWSLIFTILAFCFYFASYYCIDIRILIILVLVIFLTWYFLSKIK